MVAVEATKYKINNGAAWITLNRPENRNALSADTGDGIVRSSACLE